MEKASSAQVAGNHYKNMAIQPAEFIQRNRLNWCEGNAIKYLVRHRQKNGAEDIRKAIHYLNLLLEWEYPEESAALPSPPADPWAERDLCRRCGKDCAFAGTERHEEHCHQYRPKES